MAICTLCPRMCKADRAKGEKGFCLMTDEIVLSRAALHYWEEPCISGDRGSGTVFFSGCSLKCVYCQNRPVALNQAGKAVSIERLAEIFCELQEKKAHNINLVTPTHYVPQIIEAVNISRQKGLNIPIVYNSGGYENTDTIKLLDGIIDIYMPDFKYMSSSLSEKYSNASNYSEIVKKAIEAMVSEVGDLEFDEDGMMKKGVLIRHMLLPGCLDDSKEVMKYLYDTYKEKVYYSIMSQYTPLAWVKDYPEINRKVTKEEYEELIDFCVDMGMENAFVQEGEAAEESFIPMFDCEGV